MKKVKSKYLDCTKKMPPLKLKVGDGEFDIMKSEVARWLIQQPDILLYVVNRIKGGRGQSPYITYNPDTGKWQGVDYDGD